MQDDVMRNRLKKVSEQSNQYYQEKRRKSSKDELRRIIKQKIETTMIGAIAKFEAFFGKEWGHGLDEKDCTDAQLDFYDIWQQCRDEILNNGNAQVRAINHELDLFTIEWQGYKKEFKKENKSY